MTIFSKLIILGSGPAGITSSIYSYRLNLNPLLITGNNEGGQLCLTSNIENYPGFLNISGYNLYKKMYKQMKKYNIKIINDSVNKVIFKKNDFYLFGDVNNYKCNCLIIATGTISNKLGIPGEIELLGKGVSTCSICDGPLYKNKIVAVVGSGNTAVEESIYLSSICKKVYLIYRSDKLKCDNENIIKLHKILKKNKIILYKNTNVLHIYNDNYVNSIKIINNLTKDINIIKLSAIFIAVGHSPNTKLFKNKIKLTKSLYIKIKMKYNNFTETSVKGVFAAGDVVNLNYKQIITSSSLGCMSAIDAKNYINNN